MDFDTNVENYSDSELLQLLNITDVNPESILSATQEYIDKYSDNKEIVNFYLDIRNRLIKPEETSKVFESTVKKGTINPDLKNTVSRMINVDSSYRDFTLRDYHDSDNYVFTLNEPITNVISLMLYSIEIPQSWYVFSNIKGNTKFKIIMMEYNDTSLNKYENFIQINDGNYTKKALLKHIYDLIFKTFIFYNQTVDCLKLEQDPYSGRFILTITNKYVLTNVILPSGTNPNPSLYKYKLVFCFHDQIDLKNKINYNLGWLLGFRIPTIPMDQDLNDIDTSNINSKIILSSSSIIDIAGTKYIILKLDDYKSNRLNKSLVCINTKLEQTIPIPNYYNNSLSKHNISKHKVNVLPGAPNTELTAKQYFTINAISDNYLYNDITKQRVQSPDDSDIFAKIPIKRATDWGIVDASGVYTALDNGPGKLIIEFSGPLQLNIREYFGPVNMTSFAVALYDDKGMLLGLNGLDWSFTIIVKSIYQY
jgi:hypothetical protein